MVQLALVRRISSAFHRARAGDVRQPDHNDRLYAAVQASCTLCHDALVGMP